MKITEVRIRNFRGIKSLDLELGRVCVLIGENNTGKTSVLEALKLCLRDLGPRGRIAFDAFDFHLSDADSEPSNAEPIKVEVICSERETGEWSNQLVGRLNRARILQVDGEERNYVHLEVTCNYDQEAREYDNSWSFLDQERQPLTNARGDALRLMQELLQYHYLTALRDAGRHFNPRGPFWRPFLNESQLSSEKKQELEELSQEVNRLIVSSHDSFEQVQAKLSQLQSVVPLASGEVASIEAVPTRMHDMLSKAEVQIRTTTGAKIPLFRHGEGTQSLAVLLLFSAFLDSRTDEATILGLEEPEAHLHPSAIRVLWEIVQHFGGQLLITTHSGELIAEADIHDIRRLARTSDGIKSFQVPENLLDKEEARKFNYHIRRTRGELLFARCWLLVEGQTEAWIYPAAAAACDLNFHREGIRIVEYGQSDVGMLVRIASALGISWFCVGDNDKRGMEAERTIRKAINGARVEAKVVLPYPNIEVNLLSNGFKHVYDRYMSKQILDQLTMKPGDPGYWIEYASNLPSKAKTRGAAEIALKLQTDSESKVPSEIRGVLDSIKSLARGGGQ